jgi:hypothetical protein
MLYFQAFPPCILAVIHFSYSNYLSPFTSYVCRCLLHHLQGDHCIICSRTYAFYNVTYIVLQNVKIYPVFFKFTMLLLRLERNTYEIHIVLNTVRILYIKKPRKISHFVAQPM